MDAASWQSLGAILLLLGIGAYNGWQARKAAKKSTAAAEQTTAVSNGFAAKVTSELDAIKRELGYQRRLMIQHLAQHAGSDLNQAHDEHARYCDDDEEDEIP